MYPDFYVMKRAMHFAMLRNFGHLITNLYMDIEIYRNHRALFDLVLQYLIEYSSESLIDLAFIRADWNFENFNRQFVNVKCLEIQAYNKLNNSVCTELLENFPNLQILKIKDNRAKIPFNVKIHCPHLKHLHFQETFWNPFTESLSYYETLHENFKEFIKMNTQIENLGMKFENYWPVQVQILQWLAENLPNLKELSIEFPCKNYFINSVIFPKVLKFTLYPQIEVDCIPFLFTQLNDVTFILRYHEGPLDSMVEFISNNKHLKTIRIEGDYYKIFDRNIFRLFEFEDLLMSLEELTIRGIHCSIPADRLLRFLERNFSLKRISLMVTYNLYTCDSLFDRIIAESDFYETKIRNHTFEFTIKRISDGTSMKFYVRSLTLRSRVHIKTEDQIYFEICNYRESTIFNFDKKCPEDIRHLWNKYTNWAF